MRVMSTIGLEPLAEVQGALLVVEVLHLPHPKLLGLLHVGEHLQEQTERLSATRNQYITQKPTTQPEANRTNTQANHQPEPKPDQETAPVHFSVGGGVGSPARASTATAASCS